MLGCHVNRENKTISLAIQEAIYDSDVYSLPMMVAAIFVSNPRSLHIVLKDDEKEELIEFIHRKKINIIAHSSYVAFLWGGSSKVLSFVIKEYKLCKEVGITGLVIHLPKEEMVKKNNIIKKLINEVNNINCEKHEKHEHEKHEHEKHEQNIPIIYLETPAIIPLWANYDTGPKLSKLFQFIEKIAKSKNHPFGLCIDTAHIWTSGNDISTYEGAKRWFTELMDMPYIPYDRLLIHLNDSEKHLGCGPDKHASLTKGKIWNKYKNRAKLKDSGLYFILEFAKKNNIPIILERRKKEMLKDDYSVIQKIYN